MTTTASDHTSAPSEIWDDLLSSFAAKASPRGVTFSFQTVPATGETQEPPVIQWLESTAKALKLASCNGTIPECSETGQPGWTEKVQLAADAARTHSVDEQTLRLSTAREHRP